jgi:hypothetical protein
MVRTSDNMTIRTCSICGFAYATNEPPIRTCKHTNCTETLFEGNDCLGKVYELSCNECNNYTEIKNVEPLGHDYESSVHEPTPDSEGYIEYICSRCNDSYKDSIIPSTTTTTNSATSISTTTSVTTTTPPTTTEPAYLLGDVNNDGSVDSSDASLVLAEYAKIQTGGAGEFTEIQQKAADVNKDNSTDSSDASKILAYYAMISTGKEPTWD